MRPKARALPVFHAAMTSSIPNVLTIAGSDSGGGAGIQADLKAFSALGAYGASVITALTAQNTRGVTAIHAPDAAFVTAQLDAVASTVKLPLFLGSPGAELYDLDYLSARNVRICLAVHGRSQRRARNA